MADTSNFVVSGAVAIKCGAGVSATALTEANRNIAAAQAEAFINTVTRNNWSDDYASLNADVKYLLEEAAACWIAIDMIGYDMSGYTTRYEAESMINILWAKFWRIIDVLKDQKAVTYINGA